MFYAKSVATGDIVAVADSLATCRDSAEKQLGDSVAYYISTLPDYDDYVRSAFPREPIAAQVTDQHAPGVKLDQGKVRPDLILSGMPRAVLAVAEIATFGARKYTENGWVTVPDGVKRYTAGLDRHRLLEAVSPYDEESKFLHAAHMAWNALSRLELMLREGTSLKENES